MTGHFTINTHDHGIRKRLKRGDIKDGVVVDAEPAIAWAHSKPIKELEDYCRLMDWELKVYHAPLEDLP